MAARANGGSKDTCHVAEPWLKKPSEYEKVLTAGGLCVAVYESGTTESAIKSFTSKVPVHSIEEINHRIRELRAAVVGSSQRKEERNVYRIRRYS